MPHVAITVGGRFLRLSREPDGLRVRADGGTIDGRSTFERLELGHGRIALRTLDGRHLVRAPGGGPGAGLAVSGPDPEAVTPEAAFEEVLWPDGQVSLRSCDLTYVGTDADGEVTVDRTWPGATERFFLLDVPLALVPAQRTAPGTGTAAGQPEATQPRW